MIMAVIVSLFCGVTVVLSRTINSLLAEKTSVTVSTFFNYFTGFIFSLILFILFNEKTFILNIQSFDFNSAWIYLGGLTGVVSVFLLNATVSKMPSFSMTILLFLGQILGGIIIDAVVSNDFSFIKILGCLIVAFGLYLNLILDKNSPVLK